MQENYLWYSSGEGKGKGEAGLQGGGVGPVGRMQQNLWYRWIWSPITCCLIAIKLCDVENVAIRLPAPASQTSGETTRVRRVINASRHGGRSCPPLTGLKSFLFLIVFLLRIPLVRKRHKLQRGIFWLVIQQILALPIKKYFAWDKEILCSRTRNTSASVVYRAI